MLRESWRNGAPLSLGAALTSVGRCVPLSDGSVACPWPLCCCDVRFPLYRENISPFLKVCFGQVHDAWHLRWVASAHSLGPLKLPTQCPVSCSGDSDTLLPTALCHDPHLHTLLALPHLIFENYYKRNSFPRWKAMLSQESSGRLSSPVLVTYVPPDQELSCPFTCLVNISGGMGTRRGRYCGVIIWAAFLVSCRVLDRAAMGHSQRTLPRIPWGNPFSRWGLRPRLPCHTFSSLLLTFMLCPVTKPCIYNYSLFNRSNKNRWEKFIENDQCNFRSRKTSTWLKG